MTTMNFYKNLGYNFSIYEGEEELNGLTNEGFTGTEPLCINQFNDLELNAARDIILSYLRPIGTINRNYTSFELKYLIERVLKKDTNEGINYISNGAFILAMCDVDFHIQRIKNSPNCFFNVSEKSIKHLRNAGI